MPPLSSVVACCAARLTPARVGAPLPQMNPQYRGNDNAFTRQCSRGSSLRSLPGHDLNDLPQRLDELAALTAAKNGQQTLVDTRSSWLDGREGGLALLRQAHGIHAGIAAGALSLQQTLLDQSTDDIRQRGAVDPGLFDKSRLRDVGILGDTGEDGILAGGEGCLAGFVCEQDLGALTGPMQERQGRNVEGTRAMVVLHRMLRRC